MLAHVPREVKVTVTASPAKGLDATLAVVERLAGQGYAVVPHLSARLVRDGAHVEEIVARLQRRRGARGVRAGRRRARARASSRTPRRCCASSSGGASPRSGITGYPESHHLIDDEATIQAMFEKAPMATYIVSQICFDPETIQTWIARVRERGTTLPIWVGMPGIVDNAKLLRDLDEDRARRVGALPARPPRLAAAAGHPHLHARPADAPAGRRDRRTSAGLHFYTFNELERTERWRRQAIERLRAA